ncbi:MAG: hypothetical protein H6677_01295 [Candidatus Obscuribacterales bacterium]|nr:hypothetical protein [Candidatus Obscuribacterales bacterium]
MTTIQDLKIQRDCASNPSADGKAMADREHTCEAIYFARENEEKIAALAKKLGKKPRQCECENCSPTKEDKSS